MSADSANVPITVAYGDGIGPEIMSASLRVLKEAGARLDLEEIKIGKAVYEDGHTSGIADSSWESLRRTKVFFKAPITTPQGGGFKSLNVTVRKTLGLFANVRPSVSYAPYVKSLHPGMDVLIVRENEEDLYAGIEHRQTQDVYQCLKLVSRPGIERICRYAFEVAKAEGRKKVSCFSKDNIMKLTDGMFHKIFDEVAKEYPEIENDHWIIDIGAAKLAAEPNRFDVIVTSNLYGDIISDIASEVSGSVGMGPSSNIGSSCAMFEAVHGSAPDIAGQDIANPSGLLLAAVMMLNHIGQSDIAEKIQNAWLKTIEDGIHTGDIKHSDPKAKKVGTTGFADAVIERLGQKPTGLKPVSYEGGVEGVLIPDVAPYQEQEKRLVGVDLFVQSTDTPADVAAKLLKLTDETCSLSMISNRGVKVWPNGFPETFCTDHWRCRFMATPTHQLTSADVAALMARAAASGAEVIKTENLYTFNGHEGFSKVQGA